MNVFEYLKIMISAILRKAPASMIIAHFKVAVFFTQYRASQHKTSSLTSVVMSPSMLLLALVAYTVDSVDPTISNPVITPTIEIEPTLMPTTANYLQSLIISINVTSPWWVSNTSYMTIDLQGVIINQLAATYSSQNTVTDPITVTTINKNELIFVIKYPITISYDEMVILDYNTTRAISAALKSQINTTYWGHPTLNSINIQISYYRITIHLPTSSNETQSQSGHQSKDIPWIYRWESLLILLIVLAVTVVLSIIGVYRCWLKYGCCTWWPFEIGTRNVPQLQNTIQSNSIASLMSEPPSPESIVSPEQLKIINVSRKTQRIINNLPTIDEQAQSPEDSTPQLPDVEIEMVTRHVYTNSCSSDIYGSGNGHDHIIAEGVMTAGADGYDEAGI